MSVSFFRLAVGRFGRVSQIADLPHLPHFNHFVFIPTVLILPADDPSQSHRNLFQVKWMVRAIVALAIGIAPGCGTTRIRQATEQLVMSDAVDRSVSRIDFRPLSGKKVYLDTTYLRQIKGEGFVNAEYVTSALRQQIVAAGCLIQDTLPESDIVIEARMGALGLDDHRVTFGLPENNAISSAVSLLPNAPNIPAVPEIALARRDAQEAAAKVAAFAYDRTTREPIWQSGVNYSIATAKDTWVFGVGPFQGGSIRDEAKLPGSIFESASSLANSAPKPSYDRPRVEYTAQIGFEKGWPTKNDKGQRTSVPLVPSAPGGMEWPTDSIADSSTESFGTAKLDNPVRLSDVSEQEREFREGIKR